MTREDAINNLNMIRFAFVEAETKEQRKIIDDTFDMAIEALKQLTSYEQTINKLIEAISEQATILDKIRAEIVEMRSKQNVGVLECLDIIDKYRGEENEDSN